MLLGPSPQLRDRVSAGDLDVAVVTDAPPGLPNGPRVERRYLGTDEMVVAPPPSGIYTITPRRAPHPSAALLLDQLATTFPSARPAQTAHRPPNGTGSPAVREGFGS
ncbi:hypothetical protein [Streptomyces sp. NPDC001975]